MQPSVGSPLHINQAGETGEKYTDMSSIAVNPVSVSTAITFRIHASGPE